MNGFWVGLLVGLFVGAPIGLFAAALMFAGRDRDRDKEET